MLFRIEDSENWKGKQRQYIIPLENLPRMKIMDLEQYLAEEIRKEVNNSTNRNLLSYSKLLGVCLLKYNEFTDNELHINITNPRNYVYFYMQDTMKSKYISFDLKYGLYKFDLKYGLRKFDFKNDKRKIVLQNFQIDISNNDLLDRYLNIATGVGRKKYASPEKDKEVLLMQSPDDLVIQEYIDSVYLLYALFLKYGMKQYIFRELTDKISNLEENRFLYCGEAERYGILNIVEYLYFYGAYEINEIQRIINDCKESDNIPPYYDSILQLLGIQDDTFEDSYMLSEYNSNIISDWIWELYAREYL